MLHRLYVGANNETKEIEWDKLKYELDGLFSGYTLIDAQGVWQGGDEPSVIVEIETDEVVKIGLLVARLKETLKQQAIGHQILPSIQFI